MQNPNVHKLQPKKPMHFRCKTQMCTNCSRRNQCISDANPNVHKLQPKKPMHFAETKCAELQPKKPMHFAETKCAELQPKKPMRSKCANFFVCTGKPRITKMHFNAETPSARCKCAQMPKEIQCRCNARCNSVQQQCKKPIIPRCCNFLPHKIHQVRKPDGRRYDAEVESSE
jgi:hypothetical protein